MLLDEMTKVWSYEILSQLKCLKILSEKETRTTTITFIIITGSPLGAMQVLPMQIAKILMCISHIHNLSFLLYTTVVQE